MATRKVSSKLILVFIDVGVVLGMILGYRNYNVDNCHFYHRLSVLACAQRDVLFGSKERA